MVDADKKSYINYYEFILQNNLLNQKGLMVVDNVLYRYESLEE